MDLKTVNALVTGGASGMGREFVLSLARDGANVAFCDLDQAKIDAVVAEAASLPGKVAGFIANVADEASVIALVTNAREALGGLNVLVNNAGIFKDGLLVKKDKNTGAVSGMTLKNWQAVIDVDLTGPFLCAREFAKSCIETNTRPAVIVGISSISRAGNMGQSNYSAAKAGLVADTKLWSGELSRYGIRTGAIAPGFIRTTILEGMRPEVLEAMVKPIPVGRVGEPGEIYLGLKFIIECDFFNGKCLDIDGGQIL
jgi:3-oxoacyl-[acyl-carrier protein] reductase